MIRTQGVKFRLLFVFSLFVFSLSAVAQEYNYARLVLIYGGDIPFNFNSIKKIKEGIVIDQGTILGVTMVDSAQAGANLTGFELQVRAFNSATEIMGDASSLDLNYIRLKAENHMGFGPGFTSEGFIDLPAGSEILCSYEDSDGTFDDLVWDTNQLVISYECGLPLADGGNGSLLGETPDYYRVEIELELIPTGGGF
jgi:hypothetical protein